MTALDFRARAAAWFRLAPALAARVEELDYALCRRAARLIEDEPAHRRGRAYQAALRALRERYPPRWTAARELVTGEAAGRRTLP